MKVVVGVVCGRRRYLDKLLPCLERELEDINQVYLWNNTRTKEDDDYLYELEKKYPFAKVFNIKSITPTHSKRDSRNVSFFYKYFNKDPDTIYVKMDDDVVYVEPNFFKKMKDCWERNKGKVGLVIANCINNNVCASLQQQQGKVLKDLPKLPLASSAGVWLPECAFLAHEVHSEFSKTLKEGNISDWYFDDYYTTERVSINAISWMKGSIPFWMMKTDDEGWMTELKDLKNRGGKPNVICGNAVCVHFSFYTQISFRRVEDDKNLDDRLDEFYPTAKRLTS